MGRPTHQKPWLEEVLREAESKGWRVTRGQRYYMMWCPNPCKCKKGVHLSPSSRNYKTNLLAQLRRATCWEQGEQR